MDDLSSSPPPPCKACGAVERAVEEAADSGVYEEPARCPPCEHRRQARQWVQWLLELPPTPPSPANRSPI